MSRIVLTVVAIVVVVVIAVLGFIFRARVKSACKKVWNTLRPMPNEAVKWMETTGRCYLRRGSLVSPLP
jgi:hypothetical protein